MYRRITFFEFEFNFSKIVGIRNQRNIRKCTESITKAIAVLRRIGFQIRVVKSEKIIQNPKNVSWLLRIKIIVFESSRKK